MRNHCRWKRYWKQHLLNNFNSSQARLKKHLGSWHSRAQRGRCSIHSIHTLLFPFWPVLHWYCVGAAQGTRWRRRGRNKHHEGCVGCGQVVFVTGILRGEARLGTHNHYHVALKFLIFLPCPLQVQQRRLLSVLQRCTRIQFCCRYHIEDGHLKSIWYIYIYS